MRAFIILITIVETSSLQCYQCNSIDGYNCNVTQYVQTCSRELKEDTCVTVKYENQISQDGEIERLSYITKTCATRQLSCSWICKSLEEIGHSNCRASCCTTDLCNKEVTDRAIFYGSFFNEGANIHKRRAHVIWILLLHTFLLLCINC